jgi:predicted lipid-binding transport protein (Tim44 family)
MQNSPLLQLLVLAGIAIFLILRLKSVLGTREGFERPESPQPPIESSRRHDFEVIEGGPDRDVTDHVEEGSREADALYAMKAVEPSFSVSEFVGGARTAYEMIVMGFERGDLDAIKPFLAEDIFDTFVDVVAAREDEGLTIEAEFVGVREVKIVDATFDEDTQEAEITLRFLGELTSAVRNAEGEIIEGSVTEIKRQKDTWAFARKMGTDDPNWLLVSTDA